MGWRNENLDCCGGAPVLKVVDATTLAALVKRMGDWLAESALSERITARRCREFHAILAEYSEDSRE